mmetsp:Transcript_15511/g.22719  ORF Transcript_15511/g.22719 Transcript_15511/m.22719 type:complete len:99 (+) Transcript_15511:37-333(+)|eukprot:CAMPEP_0197236198 /NCGR_PEP_ID=MMETSP1429-20130617/3400_1 /TAXON_ID=49237 /ORGANISM="Chaetoceros  sp., Strain UNC1202" /LENGTH=98 /DNA_ID=CAMNT_0042694951 /DNA_START=37 /DNA_END=333 /DNA_ORIENTATION=+
MTDTEEKTKGNSKFLLKIKEFALHAHFLSLFGTAMCVLTTGDFKYVQPYGLIAIVCTFITTNAIPPYGLAVPESMQKAMDERNAQLGTPPAADSKKDK